jgi:hypothetical protein
MCKCIEWTKSSPPPSTGNSWPQINTSYHVHYCLYSIRLNDYNFASLTLLLLSVAMASHINGEDAFIGLATHQRSGNFANCCCIATRTTAGLTGCCCCQQHPRERRHRSRLACSFVGGVNRSRSAQPTSNAKPAAGPTKCIKDRCARTGYRSRRMPGRLLCSMLACRGRKKKKKKKTERAGVGENGAQRPGGWTPPYHHTTPDGARPSQLLLTKRGKIPKKKRNKNFFLGGGYQVVWG